MSSFANENSRNFNEFDISDVENLNDLILIQFGIEEENIKMIKYVSRDLITLLKILDNNEIDKFYKFFISFESLCYHRSVVIEDERFLKNLLG